jgi:flavodoxin
MNAVVVYESLWGNTAAIARAIAEGIGPEARALSTAEAIGSEVEGVKLIVAGAPLLGFSLPTEAMRKSIDSNPREKKPTLSVPTMRSWLAGLPKGAGAGATFETRIWWSPGSAANAIARTLNDAGYSTPPKGEKFLVTGRYGPLKDGEIERAKEWGAMLGRSLG